MSFAYERPTTMEALTGCLADGGQASILAGGTDLLVLLRGHLLSPSRVVDVKGVEELGHLDHAPDGAVKIGAAVTMNRVIDDQRMPKALAGLREACLWVATYAIRNRATIAGNVANASPVADTVPTLCVLGAEVELASHRGRRRLPVAKFIKGVRVIDRQPDEVVVALHVPGWPKATRTFFRKRQRVRGHDLALTNASIVHDPDGKRLRLSVGACTPAPVVVELDDLVGSLDVEEAVRRAMAAISPISDVRSSAEYRRDMTAVLVRRLFADVSMGSPQAGRGNGTSA